MKTNIDLILCYSDKRESPSHLMDRENVIALLLLNIVQLDFLDNDNKDDKNDKNNNNNNNNKNDLTHCLCWLRPLFDHIGQLVRRYNFVSQPVQCGRKLTCSFADHLGSKPRWPANVVAFHGKLCVFLFRDDHVEAGFVLFQS